MIDVADNARELVRGKRAREYGPPRANLRRIARAWAAYGVVIEKSDGGWHEMTEHDVAQLMIILKAVRQADGYHRDSVVDQVGYALIDELVQDDPRYEAYLRERS